MLVVPESTEEGLSPPPHTKTHTDDESLIVKVPKKPENPGVPGLSDFLLETARD